MSENESARRVYSTRPGHQFIRAQKFDDKFVEGRRIFDIAGVPSLRKDSMNRAGNQ
jgi:hypothetical protein